MKLKPIMAGVLLATTASAFAAGPGDLGAIDDMVVSVGNAMPATPFFFDTYTFSLGSTSTVYGGAFAVGLSSFSVVLQDSSLMTVGTDSSASDGFSFAGLSAGNYALSFVGFGSAPAGYGGVIAATTAPVPEPQTYALMLGGLGVMGFVAMRRRNDQA
jgi:hypothetical protein